MDMGERTTFYLPWKTGQSHLFAVQPVGSEEGQVLVKIWQLMLFAVLYICCLPCFYMPSMALSFLPAGGCGSCNREKDPREESGLKGGSV